MPKSCMVRARLPTRAASRRTAAPGWLGRLPSTVAVAVGVLLVAGLVAGNLGGADRSRDRTASTYVDAMLGALPQDAAILSFWDASTPLWHGRFVEGSRPDVLIVDDTNIVYEGWANREARIAALVCERPVFVLRLDERDQLVHAAHVAQPAHSPRGTDDRHPRTPRRRCPSGRACCTRTAARSR